jgi:4-aminobutyrate aminotransferase-like enzyme
MEGRVTRHQSIVPQFGIREPRARYIPRPGGYGVIFNEDGRIAVVLTPGGAFLPGGGQEPGESAEHALVREAMEECGLRVSVGRSLGVADELVFFVEERRHYRKRCTFFLASVRASQTTVPKEVDHELQWLPVKQALSRLSHESQRWALTLAKEKAPSAKREPSRLSRTLDLLERYESRNVTFIDPEGGWPIVWKRASGVHVWDESSGRKYLDLTAAFGVAVAGHANTRVVQAGRRQMGELLHAMGDVHPHALKAELARELSRITFERWGQGSGKTIFTNSGFEAVEAALKSAFLLTGRARVIAFKGAYHGLGYGALNVTHREHFRSPFRRQLREFATFVDFPASKSELHAALSSVRGALERGRFGAVLVEPVQARGGIRVPPAGFLKAVRAACDDHNVPLILDEIYSGFGRTGRWFACEHSHVAPDIICLGKALTGGFPLSACVGRADLMDAAWPASSGEAIHTSTFLGHPVGCAMALANIHEIQRRSLVAAAAEKGAELLSMLRLIRSDKLRLNARGLGLMAGLEIRTRAGKPASSASLRLIKVLLQRGFIFLPEGEHANVISFTPPLTITSAQLKSSVKALTEEIAAL